MTYKLPSPIPFIGARHFTEGRLREPRLVVLHSMENPDRPGNPVGVGNWFKRPCIKADCELCPEPNNLKAPGPRSSAHYGVGGDEDDAVALVQYVKDEDTAWHAPGANADGIGIEMAGYARQTAEEWLDAYSKRMIERAIVLTADLCARHNLKAQFLDVNRVKFTHLTGITTHAVVSKAWGKSSHWDPGPHFPVRWFADRVAALLA